MVGLFLRKQKTLLIIKNTQGSRLSWCNVLTIKFTCEIEQIATGMPSEQQSIDKSFSISSQTEGTKVTK